MIIVVPIDEGDEACIAWGKVRLPRAFSTNTPVTMETRENGTEKYMFNMNVLSRRISEGESSQMCFECANVSLWVKPEDALERKRADCVKLLRAGDPVLVFGRHSTHEWTDRKGEKHAGHDINADIVLPTAWLYDVLLALFAQVIAKAEPPTVRKIKDRPAPAKKERKPTIAHVNVIDDEEWRKFE